MPCISGKQALGGAIEEALESCGRAIEEALESCGGAIEDVDAEDASMVRLLVLRLFGGMDFTDLVLCLFRRRW